MRSFARAAALGGIVGASLLGAAGASVFTPVPPPDAVADDVGAAAVGDDLATTAGGAGVGAVDSGVATASTDVVAAGFLVGADASSIAPDPARWQTEGCTIYGTEGDQNLDHDHAVPDPEQLKGWPAASPDCVYLGGFGLGPVRPAQRVGHGGVWIRTVAISNGAETFVYQIADVVGWFARYEATICDDCGLADIRGAIAAEHGLDIGDVIIGSTHTHAGADTYGGWGGIPEWYRDQLRDTSLESARAAIASVQPAQIEVGEVHLRHRNSQRRDTYLSTADTGATWLQARALGDDGTVGDAIATWTTFAGHPTGVNDPILHADWPGAAARWFETRFGGVGLVFEGGLGNVSMSGSGDHLLDETELDLPGDERGAESKGRGFAEDVVRAVTAGGTVLADPTMVAAAQTVEHPVTTNPGITTLATLGLFDREFTPGTPGAGLPSTYSWAHRAEGRRCTSTGPTVITTAGAHRIGEFAVAFAPGEIFSNVAEVVKEEADRSAVTMVLGQTNDALGYLIQSFEFDTAANAATHYGTAGAGAEYEEVFAVDRCFGDHVLDVLLSTTSDLGF